MLDDKALDKILRNARTHNGWLPKPVTDDQLRAVIEEGNAAGLKVLGHTQHIKKAVDMGMKHTFWVDAKVPENKQVMHDIREKFLRYYSVNENNYSVPESYAPHQHIIAVDATQV